MATPTLRTQVSAGFWGHGRVKSHSAQSSCVLSPAPPCVPPRCSPGEPWRGCSLHCIPSCCPQWSRFILGVIPRMAPSRGLLSHQDTVGDTTENIPGVKKGRKHLAVPCATRPHARLSACAGASVCGQDAGRGAYLLCEFRLLFTCPRPVQPGVGHLRTFSCMART